MGEKVKNFFDNANTVIPTILFIIYIISMSIMAGKLIAAVDRTEKLENDVKILSEYKAATEIILKNMSEKVCETKTDVSDIKKDVEELKIDTKEIKTILAQEKK